MHVPDSAPTAAPSSRRLLTFVPTQDQQLSKRFYLALGAKLVGEEGGLVDVELAGTRLLLQDYYAKDWAENFMFILSVDDAQAWFEHVSALVASGEFPGVRVKPPEPQDWGALVTYVWDPVGVLIHIAQPLPEGG